MNKRQKKKNYRKHVFVFDFGARKRGGRFVRKRDRMFHKFLKKDMDEYMIDM